MERNTDDILPKAALAAGVLLLGLVALTYAGGASQQALEWAGSPADFAIALRRNEGVLRAILAIDDVFIAAYVTAGLMLARRLSGGRMSLLPVLVGASTLVAGLLDLEENHHLLALMELARNDVAIPLSEIIARSDRSQFKWMLGHLGFVFAGLAMVPKSNVAKLLRGSLVVLQLPIGALTWAVAEGEARDALVLVRYATLVSGFVIIAFLARQPDELVADDSGVPA